MIAWTTHSHGVANLQILVHKLRTTATGLLFEHRDAPRGLIEAAAQRVLADHVATELNIDVRTRLPFRECGTCRISEPQADDPGGLVEALDNRDLAKLLENVVQGDRCHG